MDALGRFWAEVTATVPELRTEVLLGTAAVAALLVLSPTLWRSTRNVVTIAHEGAHGLVALAAGRRLSGIRLHSDTSGLTVSAGRPTGLGMVLTCAAGYIGPGLFGLGAAALLAAGHAIGLLWALLGAARAAARPDPQLVRPVVGAGHRRRRLRRHLVAAAGGSGRLRGAGHLVPAARRAPHGPGAADLPAEAARAAVRRRPARGPHAVPRPVLGGVFLLVDVGALLLGAYWLLT